MYLSVSHVVCQLEAWINNCVVAENIHIPPWREFHLGPPPLPPPWIFHICKGLMTPPFFFTK